MSDLPGVYKEEDEHFLTERKSLLPMPNECNKSVLFNSIDEKNGLKTEQLILFKSGS